MVLNEICDLSEIIAELGSGSSLSDADRGLLYNQKQRAEASLRRFLQQNVSQPTTDYVAYLPNKPSEPRDDDADVVDFQGDIVTFRGSRQYGDVLQLPQPCVRSITEVREDLNALTGSASVFTSETLLAANTHYRLDSDEPRLSRAGQLIRMGCSWPSGPRTVRVVYMAGLTSAELDGEFCDIKDVVIEETIQRFKRAKSRGKTSAVGPIKAESLGGQWSVQYDTSERFVSAGELSQGSKLQLEHYLNLNL